MSWRAVYKLDREAAGIARRAGAAVLFIDIDRLSSVNWAHGVAAGDAFIDAVSSRLAAWCGLDGYCASMEAGRFIAVVAAPHGVAAALSDADRLRVELGRSAQLRRGQVARSVSIGLAVGAGQDPLPDLVMDADLALRQARGQNADIVVLAPPARRAAERQRAQLDLSLRSAVRNDGLTLRFQPEVDLRTGRLLAVEALARWRYPPRPEAILPTEFVEVAERSGAIRELGEWALDAACAQRAQWRHAYPHANFAVRVNLSPTQFSDVSLPAHIASLLKRNALEPRHLGIEITETARLSDAEQTAEVLGEIRELGVEIALDDYGMGYSSLARLKVLPVDAIKIDRTFVAGLASSRLDRLIVSQIMQLAAHLGATAIAEGVGQASDIGALKALGCHRAQGNFLMGAATAPNLTSVLERGGLDLSDFGAA